MPRLPAISGRILIVDDDERQRTALAAMLSDCDFDTQVAADGQEALERLTAFNADVIVSDLVMPRMDGFELLRQPEGTGRPHSGHRAHRLRQHGKGAVRGP